MNKLEQLLWIFCDEKILPETERNILLKVQYLFLTAGGSGLPQRPNGDAEKNLNITNSVNFVDTGGAKMWQLFKILTLTFYVTFYTHEWFSLFWGRSFFIALGSKSGYTVLDLRKWFFFGSLLSSPIRQMVTRVLCWWPTAAVKGNSALNAGEMQRLVQRLGLFHMPKAWSMAHTPKGKHGPPTTFH